MTFGEAYAAQSWRVKAALVVFGVGKAHGILSIGPLLSGRRTLAAALIGIDALAVVVALALASWEYLAARRPRACSCAGCPGRA